MKESQKSRKLEQDEAEYSAVGGLAEGVENACASCRWFSYWDYFECQVVENWPTPIMPTGLSNRFEAIPERIEEPLPVVIVEGSAEKKTVGQRVMEVVVGLGRNDIPAESNGAGGAGGVVTISVDAETSKIEPGFKVIDVDGHPWWVGITTNNFEDREGEIFTEAAHLAYIEDRKSGALDKGDVWIWHTPGTSFADCELTEYVDGFLIEGGPFKKDFEWMADVFKEGDWGMSHTFLARRSVENPNEFVRYTIVERGPLPREAAANPWTGFQSIIKEPGMGLSDKQKKLFTEMLGEDKTNEIEATVEGLATTLKEAGVQFKDLDDPEEPEGTEEPAEKSVEGPVGVDATGMKAAVRAIIDDYVQPDELQKELESIREDMKPLAELAESMKALTEAMAQLTLTDEEKVTARFESKSSPARWGKPASKSDDNEPEKGDPVRTSEPSQEALHPLARAVEQVTGSPA